ncbi:hypothetical protein GYA49_01375 [Candidatus Beckwithbacteria bacterium]|nr:hypothetical protein [Candidatus Beckwithbacteria bacterium]
MLINFLQKFQTLKKSVPVPAVNIFPYDQPISYCDWVYQSNDCKYCFNCFQLNRGYYCDNCLGSDLVDCDFATESELGYELVESNKCYSSAYLYNCVLCNDCFRCRSCMNCNDCFACVGLFHKSYCIFNKQYTQTTYKAKIAILKSTSAKSIAKKVAALDKKIPKPANNQFNTENCPYGDYINNCKNSFWSFNTYYLEDCGYINIGGYSKNCWDIYFAGINQELCYETVNTARSYNCAYLFDCGQCTNCYYCFQCSQCSDCFGCVGLSNKKYCILNNQLSKEQYGKAVLEIKKELGWPIPN